MEGLGPFWGAKWRGKAPFRVQHGGERLPLGCKMEVWEPFGVQNGGSEHGGGYGACALDTPRQALACARRVRSTLPNKS